MLAISIYDGGCDNISFFTRICEIEGCVVPDNRTPFNTLEEAQKVLEMYADKCSTPSPSGSYLTVFIGRKTGDDVAPLARLAVTVRDGLASASIVSNDASRVDTAPVAVNSDDDVVAIVRKVLA
jgi:hypothetical protein